MKKVYSFILFGAAILAVAACNKETQVEDPAQNNDPVYETLSVKVGAETKVTLETDAAKSSFENGDKIAVWTDAGAFQECAVSDGKITVDISGGARSNYAVYYNGATIPTFVSSTLKITLPDTYDYADVAGDKNPVPMVAKNVAGESGDMTFYSVGTLFRVTVKAIPSDATGLVFQFPGNKVNGTFTVTNPGTSTPSVATSAPDGGEDKVTVTFAAGTATEMTLNIPLPTGAYDDVYITPVSSDTKVAAARHIKAGGYTAARAHGKQFTATLVSFSVSAEKKVIFAPGNLQAIIGSYSSPIATASAWKFADNQYSCIAKAPGNTSFEEGSVVDLFGWQGASSIVAPHYGLCTLSKDASTDEFDTYFGNIASEDLKNEWGKLEIGPYDSGFWSIISSFDYLLNTRSSSISSFARVIVNNVRGLMIFPDVYTHPDGVASPSLINDFGGDGPDEVAVTSYDEANWKKLEDAGVVFLPCGGQRNVMSVTVNSNTDDPSDTTKKLGRYWVATLESSASGITQYKASALRFACTNNNPQVEPTGGGGNKRTYGFSVRLVRDLN